jgi:hypothetical protein
MPEGPSRATLERESILPTFWYRILMPGWSLLNAFIVSLAHESLSSQIISSLAPPLSGEPAQVVNTVGVNIRIPISAKHFFILSSLFDKSYFTCVQIKPDDVSACRNIKGLTGISGNSILTAFGGYIRSG